MNTVNDIKFCPLLPQEKEVVALAVGQGNAKITYFSFCLKEKCVAFKDGYCSKFDNIAEMESDQ